MSEHTVTENLVQTGDEIHATLTCACGLSVESSTRRKTLRVLRAELDKLHETKPRKQKSEEDLREKEDRVNDNSEWPDESGDNS